MRFRCDRRDETLIRLISSTVSIQLLPDTSIARPQLLPEPESRHSPVRRPSTTSQGDSDDEDDEVEMVEEEEVVMSEIINDGCHV